MAEALLNCCDNERITAFSAGSNPKSEPHPKTIEILEKNNYDISNFRSKSWDEFARADAPEIDIVITVCSNAANESCPHFPGSPTSIHWDLDDPARDFDSEEEQAREFQTVYTDLEQRIQKLTEILAIQLNKSTLNEKLKKISD
jgi:protein-tyrosine-phosphatase